MKNMKKIFALLIAMVLVLSLSTSAFAASITINSTAGSDVQTDTTVYTYYKILDATIEVAPTVGVGGDTTNQADTKVSYYVTTEAKANALSALKVSDESGAAALFKVVKDAAQDKWYVELADDSTTADVIAARLDTIKTSFADASGSFAQTAPGGTAKAEGLAPGYYLITSTLGDELVVQTLADVTINTKNEYPSVNKTIPETDKSAQIGDTITYTIPVTVPASANDTIVVTDTMTEGLTFNAITSVKSSADGTPDVTYTSAPTTLSSATVTANSNSFTITFDADTVTANAGKTITIIYTAILNEKAVVDAADEDDADNASNDNTVKINYGSNFESKTVTVETDTQKFTFDKVDGSDNTTKLPGAIFELRLNGTALNLYEVAAGETYRIATAAEITAGTNIVTQMTTTGKVITVNGVDGDVTYQLVETQAPTGYNLPENPSTDVKANTNNNLAVTIQNNKGTVLPSTGGIGTTIFYIVGAIFVIGAGVVIVTKRRMNDD